MCSVRIWFLEYHFGLPIRTWLAEKKSIQGHSALSAAGARSLGTTCPARIRRDSDRFDGVEAIQLWERLPLRVRADLFNISTTPILAHRKLSSSPLFGQSTQMLGASLGSGGQNGGLNPLSNCRPALAKTGFEASILSS